MPTSTNGGQYAQNATDTGTAFGNPLPGVAAQNPNVAGQNNSGGVLSGANTWVSPNLYNMVNGQNGTYGSGNYAVPTYTPPSSISSSQLANTPAPNFQSPTPTPLYPTVSLAPQPLQPTEQNAQNTSTLLQTLNDQLAGKQSYESGLYNQYGFNTTTDANGNIVADPGTADLSAKLTGLTNQAQAIPLQIQNNAIGHDVTSGELNPITTAQLRNNAIQALGVSSLIAAKNGQLATAQHYVDNAVQQKYGPIQEQIKAKSANLQLILNSPEYTNEQKSRAAQQQAALAQQAAALDLQKQNYTATQNEVLQYAGVADAQTLGVMQQLQTPEQVAQYAAAKGLLTTTQQQQQGALKLQQSQIEQIPLDMKLKQADLAAKQASTAQSYAAAALSRANASAFANPALIEASANGTIDPTKVNSRNVSFMSALANAGVNVNQVGINSAATKKVMTNLQTQAAQITQAGGALERNLPLLASLSDKVNTLGIPAVDTNLNAWEAKYSNKPDVVNYLSTLQTVRSEYAKYIARGGQVDDSVNREAASAIPVGINGDTLRSLLTVVQSEGANVQASIKDAQAGQWASLQGTQPAATGDSHVYNGVTYVVQNGQWVPQK